MREHTGGKRLSELEPTKMTQTLTVPARARALDLIIYGKMLCYCWNVLKMITNAVHENSNERTNERQTGEHAKKQTISSVVTDICRNDVIHSE